MSVRCRGLSLGLRSASAVHFNSILAGGVEGGAGLVGMSGEFITMFVAIAGRAATGVDCSRCGCLGAVKIVLRARLIIFPIAALSPTKFVKFFQTFLLPASAATSSYLSPGGRSMKNPPGDARLNCTLVANLTSLCPGSRSRCPSHFILRFFMSRTRSYVRVFTLAS